MCVAGNGSGPRPQRGGGELIHRVLLGMAILGVVGVVLSPFWACVFAWDIRLSPFFNLFDREPDLGPVCKDNIKQVTTAMLVYATEHDEKLPEGASWQDDIKVHLAGDEEAVEALLHCPATGQPYVFNKKIAGTAIKELGSLAEVPLIWEVRRDNGRAPHGGKFFHVGRLDGQVWTYPEDSFKELLEEWGH